MATTYVFNLPSISCADCLPPIYNTMNLIQRETPGLNYKLDVVNKQLTVTIDNHNISPETIKHQLESVGTVVNYEWKSQLRWHIFLGVLGSGAGILLMILSMLSIVFAPWVHVLIAILSVALTITLGINSYKQAWFTLRYLRPPSMHILFAVSTITLLAISVAAFFIPGLPMMFETGLMVFGFQHIGLALEEGFNVATDVTANFQNRVTGNVRKLVNGEIIQTPVENLIADDEIIVHAGEIIPVDGISLSDNCRIDDRIHSGRTRSRTTVLNDPLLAGMRLKHDSIPLHIRATHRAADSNLARLDNFIQNSANEKAPIETATANVLKYFIPSVLILAATAGVFISIMFSPIIAIQCVASLLVSACPCTLGIITPLAMKMSMKKALEYSVHFKHAKALEAANSVKHIVFDLNGTLTKGQPSVTQLGIRDDLLPYVRALEQTSNHKYAVAIRECLSAHINTIQFAHVETRRYGMAATLNGDTWMIGNQQMLIEQEITNIEPELNADERIIYLVRNREILGNIILADQLRQDAIPVVRKLQQMGYTVSICSGESRPIVQKYGNLLGINDLHPNCTPEDKRNLIQQLQNTYPVAMIGDEDNDTLPIATANFGLAIQGSSQLTRQNSMAGTTSELLQPVLNALQIAKKTVSVVKQNLVFSLLYNIAILFAAGLMLNPGLCVALMVLQTSLIWINTWWSNESALQGVLNLDLVDEAIPLATTYDRLLTEHRIGRNHVPSPPTELVTEAESICGASEPVIHDASNLPAWSP